MLANWIRQRVLTQTSGDILLGDAVDSFIGCSSVFTNDGKVHYSIEDGNNRETGVGTYKQATNSITRDQVFETLIGGVYDNTNVTAMEITNEAIVSITATVRGLTTHTPVWKDIIGSFSANEGTGYLTPDLKTLSGEVETFMFRDDLKEALSIRFAIPHDIGVGLDMFPHIRWSPNSDDTGVVRWGIEYMVAETVTGVFKDSVTIYLEQAGEGTLNKMQVIEAIAAIPAMTPNTLIVGRIFRDATHVNDTFIGDASLHAGCIHYQANVIGTPIRANDFYTWG